MKMLLMLSLMILTILAYAGEGPQKTILLKKGSKVVDLGLVATESGVDTALNYSFVLERNKSSIKKFTIKYKMKMISRKCIDYDVEIVMRPSFSQKVCTPIGNGDYQCDVKTYDQLYEAKTVCVEKGWVQQEVNKKFKVSFKKAAALSSGTVEKFVISLKQKTYMSDTVKMSADVVSSPVRYKVSGRILTDTITFKVLH